MVSVLDPGASGLGSGPGRGHCAFLATGQDTLLPRSSEMLGVTLRWTSIPSRGELKILLVA